MALPKLLIKAFTWPEVRTRVTVDGVTYQDDVEPRLLLVHYLRDRLGKVGTVDALAGILDARLAKSKWLAGDQVTIADIAVAAPMHVHKPQRLPLSDHPNLQRWMTDVEKLPCWQKTQGAVDRVLGLK